MKPKHEPGEYLDLRWEYGDPDEVYLYGHVDRATFLGEVAAYHGGSVDSQDFGTFPVFEGQIRHRWARFVFDGSDHEGNPRRALREYREYGAGRFRVTAMTPTRWVKFERCARTIAGEDGEASCWIREGHTGPCRPWTQGPQCPTHEAHTPCPDGYLEWHAWAEEMGETHHQIRCPGCGLFKVWIPGVDASR